MQTIVASSGWNAVGKDGDSFTLQLHLGMPYQIDGTEFEEWACPVSLTPLFGRLADIHGSDALQALALAMGLARTLLQQFLQDGGKLLAEDGSLLDIEQILPCVSEFHSAAS